MTQRLIASEFPADYNSLRTIRHALTRVFKVCALDKSLENAVLTCSSELTTNFLEHGSDFDSFWLELDLVAMQLMLSIFVDSASDQEPALQSWLDHSVKSSLEELSFERSGGRGASLVCHFCSDIRTETRTLGARYLNGYTLSWPVVAPQVQPTLLLLDDDAAQRALYANYLRSRYTVIDCEDVASAISFVESNTPDIIVSDVHLPTQSGIDFRLYLNRHEHLAFIPFVFLSGDSEAERQPEIMRQGYDAYLTKPAKKAELLKCAEHLLSRSQRLKLSLDQHLTRNIRQALQPQCPVSVGPYRLNCHSENTGFGGGDLLLVEYDNDTALIVLLDLMGHDSDAKFFSYAYLGYLRGLLVAQSERNPALLLQSLSQAIVCDSLLSQTFCTALALRLYSNGVVEIANAGHPQPFLITNTDCDYVGAVGTLPGLHPDIKYPLWKGSLKPGQRLALFTDGVIEYSRDISADLAKQQLATWLAETRTLTIEMAKQKIFEQLSALNHGIYLDDSLLLLIEYCQD